MSNQVLEIYFSKYIFIYIENIFFHWFHNFSVPYESIFTQILAKKEFLVSYKKKKKIL